MRLTSVGTLDFSHSSCACCVELLIQIYDDECGLPVVHSILIHITQCDLVLVLALVDLHMHFECDK